MNSYILVTYSYGEDEIMGEKQKIERISEIYNQCWLIYKKYLGTHDMATYNLDAQVLCKHFGAEEDIKDLLFWFAGQVNGVHQRYLVELGGKA